MIILDTDILSELMRADSAVIRWLDQQPRTSVWTTAITVLEIRYGLAIMPAGRRRSLSVIACERVISEDLEQRVLAFDVAAAEQTAALMASRQRAGRSREMRDTMIAGITLAQRATLATRNVRHFEDLDVSVVNPWQV
jgi:predicted nucleic acid-binding protein